MYASEGDAEFDPANFFDAFPKFLDTSETGRDIKRFNGRYLALIHANRHLINGATVLDLASHDGRWSFAALQNGATKVTGIEHKQRLVRRSRENLEFYGIGPDRCEFILGDMFERIHDLEQCDVVFCFGVFYHINDHMLLLSKIASLEPRFLIMDTNISVMQERVIELVHEATGARELVGQPSKAGLEAMFSSFGWSFDYFDWRGSGLTGPHQSSDYWNGKRLTAVVTCR